MGWNHIDLGGAFMGAEWERLGSVFGMEPHRLGGEGRTFIGGLGGMFGVCVWDGTP